MWEAIEWYLRRHDQLAEDEGLRKKGFRMWRRRLGERECEKILSAYNKHWRL
jgi:hypothetical protein